MEEAAAAQAAALSCVSAALNANASHGHLSELLLPGHSAGADDAHSQGEHMQDTRRRTAYTKGF